MSTEAERLQREFRDGTHRRLAKDAAERDPSDPFVYGRILAHLKQGVLQSDDIVHVLNNQFGKVHI